MATALSAPTAPGIPGAAPITALPNNGSTAPTTPAPIPTSAPTGQTSTSSAPATPTPVVSSSTAANQVNNVIKPAMQQGQTAIATQNANNAAAVAANPYSLQPGETTAAYNARIAAYNASKTPPSTQPTPEQQVVDTPDAGNQWYYDAQGNRIQAPIGQVPAGFSGTNPTVAPKTPVVSTATDSVGNIYTQYADGTYGKTNALGVYQGVAQQSDFTNAQQGQSLLNSINQVANGTYPLTANQQAQVDGIKAQFASLIATQETANANLTGATTDAENLYGMGTSLTGLGEIKGTVDSGLAKIADLNSKMASAIATMEDGFQTNNMTMLKSVYDVYSTAVKDRQTEIDTLQAAAAKSLQDAQDNQRANETLQLTKMMDDNTISYQAKEQALAQSTLDEKTKDDIQTQQLNKLKYQLDLQKENFTESQAAAAAAGTGAGNNLPAVSMTGSSVPDPNAQAQLLNSLPGGPNGDLATDVKGLANYTLSPADFTVRTLKGSTQISRDQMVALAQKYDPSYSDKQFPVRQAYLKSLQPGGAVGQKLVAFNTAAAHIATLAGDISNLGNTNVLPFNFVKNNVLPLVGIGSTAGARLDIGGVTGELATAFKAAGATDSEIKSLGTITQNSTPADIQAYVTSATELMAGKLGAQTDGYIQTMGRAPDAPLLSTTAITALSSLKNQGYQINIPGVQYTDKNAYIKYDPNAQANMQSAIKQLQAANLPLTPENILQMAQSQ